MCRFAQTRRARIEYLSIVAKIWLLLGVAMAGAYATRLAWFHEHREPTLGFVSDQWLAEHRQVTHSSDPQR